MVKSGRLLYGAAYYDEYMPYERLDKDIALMQKAGMNVVRIGESTWSTCEPQDGVFDFSHVTRVIEKMRDAGISVIIGTPTYAVPTWLVAAYPEILETTKAGPVIYGARQIMDITNPTYLYYAERVIRKMMEACVSYENVIGVQIDNETKAHGTAGPAVQHRFVKYLKEKFQGDLSAMNREFGLDYWSNRINAWEDFPDVRGTINASLGAEFERFQRKLAADFLMWQRNIVKPYLRDDQFITHNTDFNWVGYSFGINGAVDEYKDARAMDIAGCDIYHPTQDHLTGMEIAFGGDVTRSLKGDNYLILETEAQGFASWTPYDGQIREQAFSHVASGADMVEYWHWHSLHNAIETYWKGVLSHDFKENAVYRECCTVGADFTRIGSRLVHLKKNNRTAILVSNTALTALNWFPVDGMAGKIRYNDIVMKLYQCLYENNIECDILWPQTADDMKNYDLVFLPALYAASDELLSKIENYVKEGGTLVASFRTAFTDENIKVFSDNAPHLLNKVFGMSYSEFTYPEQCGFISERYDVGNERPEIFMELLNQEGGEPVITYDHYNWGRYAAVIRNHFGKGNALYIGCGISNKLLTQIIRREVMDLAIIDNTTPVFPIIVKRGTNQQKAGITYIFNYSKDEQEVRIPVNSMELVSGEKYRKDQEVKIPRWGFLVLEEQ